MFLYPYALAFDGKFGSFYWEYQHHQNEWCLNIPSFDAEMLNVPTASFHFSPLKKSRTTRS